MSRFGKPKPLPELPPTNDATSFPSLANQLPPTGGQVKGNWESKPDLVEKKALEKVECTRQGSIWVQYDALGKCTGTGTVPIASDDAVYIVDDMDPMEPEYSDSEFDAKSDGSSGSENDDDYDSVLSEDEFARELADQWEYHADECQAFHHAVTDYPLSWDEYKSKMLTYMSRYPTSVEVNQLVQEFPEQGLRWAKNPSRPRYSDHIDVNALTAFKVANELIGDDLEDYQRWKMEYNGSLSAIPLVVNQTF